MDSATNSSDSDQKDTNRRQAIRKRRQLGFQRLNQLSFMQLISSCPLFIAGVVTLVMALPHVDYPVFNFGPVIVAIMVFPMALIGLLATRKATENLGKIETTSSVKCMIVCNFALSLLCSLCAGVSSFFSFYVVDQCSDSSSEYYEQCLPNSRANIVLSLMDGIVCLMLLVLSVLGIFHFCTHSFQMCFATNPDGRPDVPMPSVRPGQSAPSKASVAKTISQTQASGYYKSSE